MKKLISLLIVLFLFSGFSISQVGETELTRTTQEQKEKQEKFTPEQKANWEKAKKEAVEKREAILKQKAKEIDKIYEEAILGFFVPVSETKKDYLDKLVKRIKNFYKLKEKFDKEIQIYHGVKTKTDVPEEKYIDDILTECASEIKRDTQWFPGTYIKTPELIIREVKGFRMLKDYFQKKLGFKSDIILCPAPYAEMILESKKETVEEFLFKMPANGRIVKSEVKKLDKKIKQFDKLKKKLKKGLKISKEITVEIPEDWQKIYSIGFISTWVHFKDDKEENIRKIIAKLTGQDTKVVKANRYNHFRIIFALVIAFFVFLFFIWIFATLSWINIVIGLAVGICYFIFW